MKKKTEKPEIYDKYPLWMVFAYNIAMLLVYLAGAYIMFKLSLIAGILYIIYLVILELSLYREGCRYCFYYGKRCVAGKGLIAPVFVKKGNPKKFCERKLKMKDFIPQILVVLIPLIVGIALLISRGFEILILIALIYPVFSWFTVNPLIYGKLACIHCKQGTICCPALDFFAKGKKK
ncbi:hypothetical protein KY347_05015 [Candidatus Woesearchaeota archaeon]|nr:hypothetical protein [Candidatus Woesearchaeota archaeon]